jgi:hypothetical protein
MSQSDFGQWIITTQGERSELLIRRGVTLPVLGEIAQTPPPPPLPPSYTRSRFATSVPPFRSLVPSLAYNVELSRLGLPFAYAVCWEIPTVVCININNK